MSWNILVNNGLWLHIPIIAQNTDGASQASLNLTP